MKYQAHRSDIDSGSAHSRKLEIRGDNLIQAVKDNFRKILDVQSNYHIPFGFPMTVTPSYEKGIIGGQGGIELYLEWMYSDQLNKPETLRTHKVWIYGQESDLTDTTSFTVKN
jgi:hypothetical protein